MTEHQDQCAVVSWFKQKYPKYSGCIIAIPNGSAFVGGMTNKNLRRYNYLVAEGMKKGASDLFIAVPSLGFSGLWVEMKAKGRTLCHVKPEQRAHIELMGDMGYKAGWCAGFDKAKDYIEEYMKRVIK